jgi:hypothetical protein
MEAADIHARCSFCRICSFIAYSETMRNTWTRTLMSINPNSALCLTSVYPACPYNSTSVVYFLKKIVAFCFISVESSITYPRNTSCGYDVPGMTHFKSHTCIGTAGDKALEQLSNCQFFKMDPAS